MCVCCALTFSEPVSESHSRISYKSSTSIFFVDLTVVDVPLQLGSVVLNVLDYTFFQRSLHSSVDSLVMKFSLISALAIPAAVAAHANIVARDLNVRQAASAAASAASSSSKPVVVTISGSAAAVSSTPAPVSSPPTVAFSVASTNPTAVPVTQIISGASSSPTLGATTSYAAGAVPTFLSNAPALPDREFSLVSSLTSRFGWLNILFV